MATIGISEIGVGLMEYLYRKTTLYSRKATTKTIAKYILFVY